uniref:G-protein coupled receptors family 1 profile domain-containing protein n=1 Tax=Naja naja TaxID=35670 RepID=A0A8C6YCE0_NAJNA
MNNSTAVGLADVQCQLNDPLQFVIVPATYCLVLCVGLPGNVAALLVFLQNGRVRKAIRIYLLNLTLADIFFNLTLPFWITYYLAKGHWSLPEVFCRLAGAIYYLSTYSAMAFMTLISLNRYCTVAKVELVLNRPRGALISCVMAWILCLLCAIPSLMKQQTHQGESTSLKCFEQHSGHKTYAYAMVVIFTLSFLVVLGTYLSIMRTLSTAPALSISLVIGTYLSTCICKFRTARLTRAEVRTGAHPITWRSGLEPGLPAFQLTSPAS